MKQGNFREFNYLNNQQLAKVLQPIAIDKFYSQLWPDASIVELDIEYKNALAGIIDKGGADKLIKFKSGRISFLAQRFRSWEHKSRTDWTIRETEFTKVNTALQNGGFIASFYAYGYANKSNTDFIKFYVIDYQQAIKQIAVYIARRYYRLIKNVDNGPGFYAIPWKHLREELFLRRFPDDLQGRFDFGTS